MPSDEEGEKVQFLVTAETGALPDTNDVLFGIHCKNSLRDCFFRIERVDNTKDSHLVTCRFQNKKNWQYSPGICHIEYLLVTLPRNLLSVYKKYNPHVRVDVIFPDVYGCQVTVREKRVAINVGHDVITRITRDKKWRKRFLDTIENGTSTAACVCFVSTGQIVVTSTADSWEWMWKTLWALVEFLQSFQGILPTTPLPVTDRCLAQCSRRPGHDLSSADPDDCHIDAHIKPGTELSEAIISKDTYLRRMKTAYPQLQFTYDANEATLDITGRCHNVKIAAKDILNDVSNLSEHVIQLTDTQAMMMEKTEAQHWFQQTLDSEGVCCSWELRCFYQAIKTTFMLVISESDQKSTMDTFQQCFGTCFQTSEIRLGSRQVPSLLSDSWKQFYDDLQRSNAGKIAPVLQIEPDKIAICDVTSNMAHTLRDVLEFLIRSVTVSPSELRKNIGVKVLTEMRQEVKEVQTEMRQEVKEVQTEMRQEVKEVQTEMRQEVKEVQADNSNIRTEEMTQTCTRSKQNKGVQTTENTAVQREETKTTENTAVQMKDAQTTENTAAQMEEVQTTENTAAQMEDTQTTENTAVQMEDAQTTENTAVQMEDAQTQTQVRQLEHRQQQTVETRVTTEGRQSRGLVTGSSQQREDTDMENNRALPLSREDIEESCQADTADTQTTQRHQQTEVEGSDADDPPSHQGRHKERPQSSPTQTVHDTSHDLTAHGLHLHSPLSAVPFTEAFPGQPEVDNTPEPESSITLQKSVVSSQDNRTGDTADSFPPAPRPLHPEVKASHQRSEGQLRAVSSHLSARPPLLQSSLEDISNGLINDLITKDYDVTDYNNLETNGSDVSESCSSSVDYNLPGQRSICHSPSATGGSDSESLPSPNSALFASSSLALSDDSEHTASSSLGMSDDPEHTAVKRPPETDTTAFYPAFSAQDPVPQGSQSAQDPVPQQPGCSRTPPNPGPPASQLLEDPPQASGISGARAPGRVSSVHAHSHPDLSSAERIRRIGNEDTRLLAELMVGLANRGEQQHDEVMEVLGNGGHWQDDSQSELMSVYNPSDTDSVSSEPPSLPVEPQQQQQQQQRQHQQQQHQQQDQQQQNQQHQQQQQQEQQQYQQLQQQQQQQPMQQHQQQIQQTRQQQLMQQQQLIQQQLMQQQPMQQQQQHPLLLPLLLHALQQLQHQQ